MRLVESVVVDGVRAELYRAGNRLSAEVFPANGESEEMAMLVENGALVDYDGIEALPRVVLDLVRKQGIRVGAEFYQASW